MTDLSTTSLLDVSEQTAAAVSAALGEPEWLRDRRVAAAKALVDLPWPTPRDEDWRHTSPRRIPLDRPLLRGGAEVEAQGVVAAVTPSAHARIVDGAVGTIDVGPAAAQAGVVVAELASAATGPHADLVRTHLGTVVAPTEVFAAANLAAHTAGVLVVVPDGAELTDPIAVSVSVGQEGASLPRVLAVVGDNAHARLYVDHHGEAAATVVEVVECVVGRGSTLEVLAAQDWGRGVAHVAHHRASVGRDATFRSLEATLGGDTVYVRPDVGLDHEGAAAELFGVYFGSDGQQFEHRSQIHHNASHTTSNSVYKGALQGRSRATWFGNIRIEPHAKATVSDETNRNLILTEGAKADSIPFLEIETADVTSCGHHSSIGQVDESQLFYLESRGISRDEATRLLVYGFFNEVIEAAGLPGAAEALLAEISNEVTTAPTTLMDQRRR